MQSTQEHFSQQVTESRQVFIGIPNNETQSLEVVSLGFEKCYQNSWSNEILILKSAKVAPKKILQP